MKRWWTGFGLVFLACIGLFFTRATDPSLLRDSDTAFLLKTIREVRNPLHWFAGDWPLGNHFYRPVSTLFFEFDNWIYGNNAAGYGLTNVLLVIGCTLALFWLIRELTDHPGLATVGTLIFASWEGGLKVAPGWLVSVVVVVLVVWGVPAKRRWWLLAIALPLVLYALMDVEPTVPRLTEAVLGIVAPWLVLASVVLFVAARTPEERSDWKRWVAAPFLAWFFFSELGVNVNLVGVVTDWLPGRTASVMSLFVLIAMAAYARYERLGAVREAAPKGPLDPPATKGTALKESRVAWPWVIVAIVGLGLALGAYEQAVMAPSLLLAVAVTLRLQRYRVRWGWQAAFWSLLIGYLVLRAELVPRDISQYQGQALRFGPGVWLDLSAYVLPGLAAIHSLWMSSGLGAFALVDARIYALLVDIGSNVAALAKAKLHGTFLLAGYGMSVLAFLPMAWLVRFDHYHYLPLAFRSLFVAAVGWTLVDVAATAVSPRGRQAPARLSPAPGSLPRR